MTRSTGVVRSRGSATRDARLLVVGLAPAAHGGNRTGRVFTGDRSGDWLFAAHCTVPGSRTRSMSEHADDGLVLSDAYVAAAVRCAPPANKPTPAERDRCVPYLQRELTLLERVRVLVALGKFAYDVAARLLAAADYPLPSPRPRFAHGLEVPTTGPIVVCCFHPSQQNTFTGKFTEEMLDAVFVRARALTLT